MIDFIIGNIPLIAYGLIGAINGHIATVVRVRAMNDTDEKYVDPVHVALYLILCSFLWPVVIPAVLHSKRIIDAELDTERLKVFTQADKE